MATRTALDGEFPPQKPAARALAGAGRYFGARAEENAPTATCCPQCCPDRIFASRGLPPGAE
jgi:hypothetical protein